MLKYELNTKFIRNDVIPINIIDYGSEELLDEESNEYKLMVFTTDGDFGIDKNSRIKVVYEKRMPNDDNISFSSHDFVEYFTPYGVNNEKRCFTLLVNKYQNLNVNSIQLYDEEEEETSILDKWCYVRFLDSHIFDVTGGKTYSLYISYDIGDGKVVELTVGETIDNNVNCEFVNSYVVRFKFSEISDLFEGGVPAYYFDDVTVLKVYRDYFIFDYDFSIYLEKPMATVSIPLSQQFSTNLYQEDALRDKFVKNEVRKSINPIVEMEKDVYHPVIIKNNKIEEVHEIRFNLHFREHRGDDWLAEENSYWNGVDMTRNDKFVQGFFSYSDKSVQSDLLTYLNFTDKDVRYQKNKLRKSFIRVMFYDSMNPGKQNMLAYYTVFLDSGNLFSKYARYIEKGGYRRIPKSSSSTVKNGLVGIRVDREPSENNNEELRLSSQFVIKDKYMSDSSSEGFYLYLWKDNFLGELPQDIYMKVEFNHAGYGRTIPFMCPYKDNNGGFKSFSDIVNDWDNGNGYGIMKYLRYSYIKFKYRYDKDTKRHIYYLDPYTYGADVGFDNMITLNLYEAKIV